MQIISRPAGLPFQLIIIAIDHDNCSHADYDSAVMQLQLSWLTVDCVLCRANIAFNAPDGQRFY